MAMNCDGKLLANWSINLFQLSFKNKQNNNCPRNLALKMLELIESYMHISRQDKCNKVNGNKNNYIFMCNYEGCT